MKKRLILSMVGVFILALTVGCAKNSGTKVSEDASTSGDAGYPIKIKHALGETVIEKKPERIVTLGWENQDTPLSLGVAPVGVSMANYGKVTDNKLHSWTDKAFKDLGVEKPVVFSDADGFDYEGISDANPDVILAAYSGMTKEEYETLSKIAPVVTYQNQPWQTTWREQTILNAEGMGRKADGEKKVEEVEKLIAEKLKAYPKMKGAKVGFFWISPDDYSKFYAYLPTDPRMNFLLDLGFKMPQSVTDLAGDTKDFSVTISKEQANKLNDVQVMVLYGDESLVKKLQADPLMNKIPAIRDGAVVLIDTNSDLAAATTPSILSIPYSIDEYLSSLGSAYEKVTK